jgi:spermidine synthase
VGIVGLGTGTLASYGRPGDRYTIYEINPNVIQIANTQFDFLRDSAAQIEIVLGDARLSLEREAPQNFNVLAVDAFSGDAIPVHLLTREAFRLYLNDLAPQGILAVHISNKFLDLAPVVEAAARDLGVSWKIVVNQSDKKQEILASSWMLVSRDSRTLADAHFPEITFFQKQPRGLRVWTDDYSNLLRILK